MGEVEPLATLCFPVEREGVVDGVEAKTHQKDRLQRLLSPIDVVAQEQEVGSRRKAAHLKHPDEVSKLAMDVADDLDRRAELDQRRLAEEHLPSSETYGGNFCVLERG